MKSSPFCSVPALQGDLDPGPAQEHLRQYRQVRHHGQGCHRCDCAIYGRQGKLDTRLRKGFSDSLRVSLNLTYSLLSQSHQGLQPQHHRAPRPQSPDGQEAQQLLQRHRGALRVSGILNLSCNNSQMSISISVMLIPQNQELEMAL